MRANLHWITVIALLLGGWVRTPQAPASNQDNIADREVGQPDFTSRVLNNGSLSAASLNGPGGVALDGRGNLYVADTENHRVLEYDAPLTTTHQAAARVFGQPDFLTNTANYNGVSATSLKFPVSVALDAAGNLYVADYFNNRVLEYDAPLTTTAQAAARVFGQPDFTSNTPNNGGTGGNPTAASLQGPNGVALDAAGNLYVADYHNHRVLEYDAPLTTHQAAARVFGQPDFTSNTINNGGIGGNPTAASLSEPTTVALDAVGNLYVGDHNNNRVLEYDAPLTTHQAAARVFGQPDFTSNTPNNGGTSGKPTAASLDSPNGVSLDAAGNLYVADSSNHRVLEYDAPLTTHQSAVRVFGQGGSFTSDTPNNGGVGGNPTAASLYSPFAVSLDAAGNLYVADSNNYRVLEYDVPVPHGPPALAALSPSSVAAGSSAFTLTVNGSGFVLGSSVRWNGSDRPTTFLSSQQLTALISGADLAGGGPFAVTVFTPTPGGGTSSLINLPVYPRGRYDVNADTVQGQPNFAGNSANNLLMPPAHQLKHPGGVAVDSQSGRLFVADTDNHRVLSWPNASALANAQPADLVLGQPNFLAHTANTGGLSGRSLKFPNRVALDTHGNLYVADFSNNRVLEYDAPLSSGMAASRVFGQGGSFTTGLSNNGGVSANSLAGPAGLALDKQDNLYVADYNNNRVLEYNTPLTLDTTADDVFGQGGSFTTTVFAPISAASLRNPAGVAVDAAGNLYVSDRSNSRVVEYDTPLSTDTTADRVFGQPDFSSHSPNQGGVSAASLNDPQMVAVDAAGDLFVADFDNNRVLEYGAPLTSTQAADHVFGQGGSFTTTVSSNVSANSLFNPTGVALDTQGNLYVADYANSRVLEYDVPLALRQIFLPLLRR